MKSKIATFLAGILLAGSTILHAQNPYKSLGVEAETLTLSKGKFVEFFPNDSLVQIGSIILNTRTNSIVSFVVYDTTYSEATLEPEVTSRFLQPDPYAAKYPEVSPYVYTLNNPIRYFDPDGRQVCCEDLLASAAAWFSAKINGAKAQLSAMMGNSRASYSELDRMSPEQQIEFHEMKEQSARVEGAFQKWGEYNQAQSDLLEVVPGMDAATDAYEGGYGSAALKLGAEFIPLGAGLKNVRKITSGRLSGYLRGNTELTGGADAAMKMFKELTGEAADGDMLRVILKDGREVFYRSANKADSGVPKIEIIDHNNSTLEKISFTND